VAQDLPGYSKVIYMRIRPNTVLVRPYVPNGFTKEGLYVTTNDMWPRVWGFVLACPLWTALDISPGDLILFERYSERLVDYDHPRDPRFAGEKQPIAILHEDAIIAKLENVPMLLPV
jgi:hypothetical protein